MHCFSFKSATLSKGEGKIENPSVVLCPSSWEQGNRNDCKDEQSREMKDKNIKIRGNIDLTSDDKG